MTYDLWHMRTCDFLLKYGMISNFYERIGWSQKLNSEFLCSTYMSSLGTKYQFYHWLCIGTRNIKKLKIQNLLVCVTYELSHCQIAFIKPSTDLEDKSEISQKPLIFTNLDILLIYTNLNDLQVSQAIWKND